MSFRILALAGAAAMLLAIPLPTGVSAQPAPSVEVGPGGVRIHERDASRYRDDRRGQREDRGCRTVTVREEMPNGNVKVIKRREC